jgi:ABC-type phosphonate transport system ATPase subunit
MSAITEANTDPSTSLQSSKPRVVGIYGVSGSGKTYLLKYLEKNLGIHQFQYYDGSSQIEKVAVGGLSAFREMNEIQRREVREKAITTIRKECEASGRIGIVAGHLMFWDHQKDTPGDSIWTNADSRAYTHILYLSVPAKRVAEQ